MNRDGEAKLVQIFSGLLKKGSLGGVEFFFHPVCHACGGEEGTQKDPIF
jgi:hypothetical protein